jgi:hypothetical protein
MIWVGALLLYAAFLLWYDNWRGPLTPTEIEEHMGRLEASAGSPDPERLATMRAFLEADDGREFFMLNLIRLNPDPVIEPGSGEPKSARSVLERYTGHFLPALMRRAGHPAFVGPAAGGYVEHWGVAPDPGWSVAGVIRYRSRRDVIELATDPAFGPAHAYKIASARQFFGPRVCVALALATLAALADSIRKSFGG